MQDLWQIQYSYLIPLLPLLGACIAGFFGARWLKGQSHWPIWIGVGASAVISISLLFSMLGLWKVAGHEKGASAGHAAAQRSVAAEAASEEPPLAYNKIFFHWITAGDPSGTNSSKFFNADAGFLFDPLTAVMLCVVTGIGFVITVFSAGYMKGEEGYFRFFAYLGLFIFAMTCLVMGNNLVMLYLGWEGVGLCSYLLIGYYYEKPSAREAAKKAFLVNRVGDFNFGLGIMLSFLAFGTITFFSGTPQHTGLLEVAQAPLTAFQQHALRWIPFLLMFGAFGKSAQFPLHVWLPDAMEGPTPVSALIHAATMVTAGVYMIARCGTLFVGNAAAMNTIAAIGCFTALMAGTIALRQFDLKKVFAYSTVSQLGFMFVAVGCLAPVAGVFHLVTHAFFKALLFLSCGVVMHAMAGELDMRKFSGLKRVLPKTRILMLIGCAALAGFPLITSGFYSKDEIVAAAWEKSRFLAALMLFAAFLTAYYSFRLYFRVFEGPEILPSPPENAHGPGHGHGQADGHDAESAHATGHHHNHEPWIMIGPLVVLAIGAIFAGFLNFPERARSLGGFLGQSPSFAQSFNVATRPNVANGRVIPPLPFGQIAAQEELELADKDFATSQHSLHRMLMIVSGLISLLGIYFAYLMHLKDRTAAERLANDFPAVTSALEHKYWIDEIYQNGIVEPLRALGRGFFAMDRIVVDGIVWLISFVPQASGFALKLTTQRGYLQGYAVTMLFGIAVILLVVFL